MTTTDVAALRKAIDEVAVIVQGDGATLRVLALDEAQSYVELAVEFADVECEECVLPPDRLRDMVTSALSRRTGRAITTILHDPRAASSIAAEPAGQVVVLDPTGVAPSDGELGAEPDVGPLRGKTVAIRHDILWRSFDWTVAEWTAELESAGATVLTWRRVQGLVGADYDRAQAEYETMLASADLAISGLANCGSCTSWSIRDALTAASRGLPTTAVATAHFEPLARMLATDGGRPGLRVVVLPYPYDTLQEDEVRAHARAAYPQLLEVLGVSV